MNKIYILMATYNGAKYIKEQIDSLLFQTYQNWELIIHDDNSTDATVGIIKEYQNKYPDKIKLIDDKISTGGAKNNFTYLLNMIDDNYDYIMFCDQDDIWIDNKIEIALNAMVEVEKTSKNTSVLVHTDLIVVDEKLNIISKSMFKYQNLKIKWSKSINKSLVQNCVTGCTVMINKQAKELSLPIPEIAIMHDWWILLKVLNANGIIKFVNTATIMYRQHENNHTGASQFTVLKLTGKLKLIYAYKAMAEELGLKISIFKIIFIKILVVFDRIKLG